MARDRKDRQTKELFPKSVPQHLSGFYSGDKPNRNLSEFAERHAKENPYNPESENYDIPAFDEPIETTKATALYNMHTYWSKKPHDAIRKYIRHYTASGDLVLDPFCGSGGTVLSAIMEGRKAIAIDLSPAATFITKNYCTPLDVDRLEATFENIITSVEQEIGWLYATKCDRCGGPATTSYTVYSQVFECPRCLKKVPLYDCISVQAKTAKGKSKDISLCPHCFKRGLTEEINVRSDKHGSIPVLTSYICGGRCKPKRGQRHHNDQNQQKREYFTKYDLNKIHEIEQKRIPYWYPTVRMMNADSDNERWGLLWRPYLRGIERACDFFTKRNLYALSAILNAIRQGSPEDLLDFLLFVFTGTLLNVSKLIQVERTRRSPNTYYVPPVGKEVAVLSSFKAKFRTARTGLLQLNINSKPEMVISTQSAHDLSAIPTGVIDYVFTDPAYGSRVQYGELNFLWEAWLGLDTSWIEQEIIINEHRGIDATQWQAGMRAAFGECFRVLKPGRAISVCYHDSDTETWVLFQDLMAEIGFITEQTHAAVYIETGQKTHKQTVADNITKRDLVMNFRKPHQGEVSAIVAPESIPDDRTFIDKVRAIMCTFLGDNPGAPRDRIYDEVVNKLVQKGELEFLNFDDVLKSVAEETRVAVKRDLFRQEDPDIFGKHEVSRWYLKDVGLAVTDETESILEDKAIESLTGFIIEYLKDHRHEEGAHYSDIFEHYVFAVKDKPRRQLTEFLPDYFYKTETGTWRLPASSSEEEAKRIVREKGLGRRIKRFIAWIGQGVKVSSQELPSDATLAEWIRHCKRAGLYDQGKFLYERGGLNTDALPEDVRADVEEDYQVCVRMLGRSNQ